MCVRLETLEFLRTRGEAGLSADLRKQQSTQTCVCGWLQHHGVAHGESRADLGGRSCDSHMSWSDSDSAYDYRHSDNVSLMSRQFIKSCDSHMLIGFQLGHVNVTCTGSQVMRVTCIYRHQVM